MFKNRPLLLASLIFGGIGLLIIIVGACIYVDGGKDILNNIAYAFGMSASNASSAVICQFGIVFEMAAMLLGYRALVDEADQ